MSHRLRLPFFTAALTLCSAAPALAHIRIDSHTTRDGDAQKAAPCGTAGSQWGAAETYEFEPGQEIEISVNEYVAHPGYFRISFSQNGGEDLRDPVSIFPIDAARVNQGERDQDKASDFCNNPTVVQDNLDAHNASILRGAKTWTYKFKIPDVECEKCTIQIVQVMEDTLHGPYNVEVEGAGDLEDLYFQCIDVVVKANSGTPSGKMPACTCGPAVGNQVNDEAREKSCSGMAPTGEPDDVGTPPDAPSERDAATPEPTDPGDDAAHDDDHEGHEDHGSRVDAGTSTKRDAGRGGDQGDEDEDEDEPAASTSDDGGCSLMASAKLGDGAWWLLALGLVAHRRRRRR